MFFFHDSLTIFEQAADECKQVVGTGFSRIYSVLDEFLLMDLLRCCRFLMNLTSCVIGLQDELD